MPQNGINARGISALADAFAVNRQLRIINLSDNTFTADGSVSMAAVSALVSVCMCVCVFVCIWVVVGFVLFLTSACLLCSLHVGALYAVDCL